MDASAFGRRHVVLAALLGAIPLAASAQQQPVYGCRQSINCRPSPVGNSALNDGGIHGLLIGGSVRWGPGFHAGIVTPLLKIPLISDEPEVDLKTFRLRSASLLPTPEAAPLPTPTPTPRVP